MNPNKQKEIQIYTYWSEDAVLQRLREDQPEGKKDKLSKATMKLIPDLKIATLERGTQWNSLDIQKEITVNLKLYVQLNF